MYRQSLVSLHNTIEEEQNMRRSIETPIIVLARSPVRQPFTIVHTYGPFEPWIEKTWRPGENEIVK